MKFTPEQLIKYAILELVCIWDDAELPIPNDLTPDIVDEMYDDTDDLYDAINEIRTSGEPTGLDAPYSRHYESDAVAIKAPNGQWVGFTYWHGGGKHGEPEAIEWMEYAYHVDCKEERKMMTVYNFTKPE